VKESSETGGRPEHGQPERTRPVRVVVADDHAMFRESVAEMLSLDPDIEVVGQAENGADAVAIVTEKRPDVVVLDVEMPVMGAQAAMRRMSRLDPPPRFVIVTVFAEPRLVRELLRLGASAYLPKTAYLRELVAAVHVVARNEGDTVLVSLPRETLEKVGRGPEDKLTDRELEVLVLAARGESNAGIARTLNLAEGTIKRHLHNTYGKLGVGSRGEALNRALSEGWISFQEIARRSD
jgi:DNA-binding NarL/FixJ family response regulator